MWRFRVQGLEFRFLLILQCSKLLGLVGPTWTLKVCKIMALMAVVMGLGLFYFTDFWGLGKGEP